MRTARVSSLLFALFAVIVAVSVSTGPALATPGVCESLPGGAVELESTGGAVGPTGYTTLGAALADVSNGTYTGVISIDVCGDTTEGASAVLGASGTGGASYSGVTISPADGGARTISGGIAGSLIDLSGADSVVIDGLNSGGNALTLENTDTGELASTIRFIADASSNTVQNCTIKGAGTGTASGTIVFATGTTTGNANDTITGNTITSSGSNLPVNAIYSAGTSTSIANTGIAITNNNIQDYFNATFASNGILVASNSAAWTITGNRLFQTATRTATTGNTHRAINIVSASGGGYTVGNNTIGYADAVGTGITTYVGAVASLYRAIEMNVAAAPASEVQGNTVTAISFTTTSNSSAAPGVFAGISVLGGSVNIGTTAGNTIGSISATGAITVTSTVTGSLTEGIYANAAGATFNIQNNNVGGITASSATPAIGFVVRGIHTDGSGASVTLNANTIGSAIANSIQVGISGTTTAVTTFAGILNAASGAITITNNTVQSCSALGTGAGSLFHGINNTGGSGTLAITDNSVIAGTSRGTGATPATQMFGIATSAVVTTANVNNNTIRNMSLTGTIVTFQAIVQSGAVTGTINLNNNKLGKDADPLVSYSSAVTSAAANALFGIFNSAGTSAAALFIQGNDVRGVSYGVAGANENDYINVAGTTAVSSQTITGNTFTSLSVNTTGTIFLIRIQASVPAGGSQNINNNAIVTSFAKTGAGGTVHGINVLGASPSTAFLFNNNNNFSNITVGNTTVNCVINTDSGTKTINGNVCNNWTGGTSTLTGVSVNNGPATVESNTITNFTSAGNQTGILVSNATPQADVTSNTVSGLATTGGSPTGLNVAATTTNASLNVIKALSTSAAGGQAVGINCGALTGNVFRNKVYDLTLTAATGSATGMTASGGTDTFSNNLIGDLKAPNANSPNNTIIGFSGGNAVTVNLYYNTIYIPDPPLPITSINFSSSAVTLGVSSVTTLRNNIFVNAATPTGTGRAVALFRGNANPYYYHTSSNNNDLYASTIYYDGTNAYPTMGAFWSQVAPRESASFSELPPFVSTAGADPAFLHIIPGSSTQLESNGVNISGFTNDYDLDIRQGNPGYPGTGTAPDIGADEFAGLAVDLTPPSVAYAALGNGAPSTSRTLTATATDQTGVELTSGIRPRIYYKKSTDPNDSTGWKYTEATGASSPFTFTIDYTQLNAGSVSVGDTIQYFVVAQDTVATPNVGIYQQGTFAAAPTSVALTPAAFPIGGTINSYAIITPISGPLTVCPGACDYTSLTNAGGLFEALNGRVFTGNVTVDILGDSTAETGLNALNQWPEDPAGNFTLTIRPGGGAARIVSGSFAGGLIRLNGADRVTIDGLNTDGNSLTMTNTSTANPSATIHLLPAGTFQAGASNNTIRNLNIVGSANTNGITGIAIAGAAVNTPGQDNDGNTISGNTITRVYYAIYVRGASNPPPAAMDNLVIANNILGPPSQGTESLGLAGIYMYGAISPTVSGNTIRNIKVATAGSAGGIYVVQDVSGGSIANNTITNLESSSTTTGTGSITGIFSGTLVSNLTISGNRIQGVSNIATGGARGIILNSNAAPTPANITVANNVVTDVSSTQTSSNGTWPMGIDLDGASDTYRVYHNSVNLFGSRGGGTAGASAALFVGSSVTNVDIRDNALSNSFDNSTQAADKCYAIYSQAPNTTFTTINNNDYYVSTGGNTVTPVLGFLGSDRTTLGAWQGALGGGKDLNSIALDPLFTLSTDLKPLTGSPLIAAGTGIATVTTDINGAARDAVTPTIGAFEDTADLAVTNSDSPDPVAANSDVTYTVTVTNNGFYSAVLPVLTNTLPASPATSFVSVTPAPGWTCGAPSGGVFTCTPDAGTLTTGASAVFTVLVHVNSCVGATTITNTAVVASSTRDLTSANNTAAQTTTTTDDGSCSDGNGCTVGDHCEAGSCVSSPKDCSDENECTDDSCSAPSGTCINANRDLGSACGSASSGPCDNPDTCDGSGICLTNHAIDGSNCGDAGADCVNQDTCQSGACQDNGYLPDTTLCGNAGDGICDLQDTCSGIDGNCVNRVAPVTTTCGNPGDGICDLQDTCSGFDGTCVNRAEPPTTTCGDADGPCTNQDYCDGSGACDDNGYKADTTQCGNAGDGICDLQDTCSGTDSTCVDRLATAETECRAATGECDIAETCTGTSAVCPADQLVPDGTSCGGSSGCGASVCQAGLCRSSNEVDTLNLGQSAGTTTLSWNDLLVTTTFHVYRGAIWSGRPWQYNHACLQADVSGSSYATTEVPPVGTAYYFLVSRMDSACGESILGYDSAMNPIPNDHPCPEKPGDADGDTIGDFMDNCPLVPNTNQQESDCASACDNHGDACDNCPLVFNPTQENVDGDTLGDACDPDIDNDGVLNEADNCPYAANPLQEDSDNDSIGDACDSE